MRMLVNNIAWTFLNGGNADQTGMIPHFLSRFAGRTVAEQFHENYSHGGGWSPYGKEQWDLRAPKADVTGWNLKYPGDHALKVRALAQVGEELVLVFDYGIVCIRQPNGSFEVARLD